MNLAKKVIAAASAVALTASIFSFMPENSTESVDAAENVSMEWGTLRIGGGGFVSGIVTGQREMYARTDVGGAYKYNYETESWEQLFGFLTEADRGLLSVDAMAIDPTDDDTVYFLCGCAYFSSEKTVIFKTTDGGKTFKEINVSDEIKVMGNGDGRQCGESIAVNPDNPKEIYAGGDVACGKSALIKSTDGGETWKPVTGYDSLGLFEETTKWPTWTENIARSVTSDAYNNQNGVAAIAITGGKVYVATSAKGVGNVHVASTKDDKYTLLSKDLPTDVYPSRINIDANGELLISYIAGLAFNGATGGGYRYSPSTGKVSQILGSEAGYGSIFADPENPDHLIAATCGKWQDQLWEPWTEEHSPAWGDQYYRSTDGGKTWSTITPGKTNGWGGELLADYLQDGGYDWIRDKAIHWTGTMVTDPRDSSRAFITSGNGVFVATDIWGKCPVYTFHPDGIEEVVSLDFVSTSDGLDLSAIGDYDGFVHESVDKIGLQYNPNMGSTSAIAVCPQNTDVWVRIAEGDTNNSGGAYYTLDRGKTWNDMTPASKGGKAAITELSEGKYRIFNSGKSDGNVSYSDDFGKTWNECTGIPSQYGSKSTMLLVEPDKPNVVYAYATYYNSSWFYSKDEPDATDAQYKFCVSTDYGKTFTSVTDICMYDMCDSAGRIGYLGEGDLILGGGYYGMYRVKVDGTKVDVQKINNVSYCKTVGYGAPEKKGGLNTIFMYGRPAESDPEGIYRSTDAGKTWVCINTDHIYGGTGNGNYLVGDMDEFGTVYMSTVGCGIVYGKLSNNTSTPPVTTTTPTVTTTSKPAVTTTAKTTTASNVSEEIMYGDINGDKSVDLTDLTTLALYLLKDITLEEDALKAADVNGDGNVLLNDLAYLKVHLASTPMILGPKNK